ncbi:MAG: AAA domain-containing protein [Candidatus Lokiarchaeota archaeon]|nr:AAA domain-containing protein [Candidatus Lokiarchaeota archaeon]
MVHENNALEIRMRKLLEALSSGLIEKAEIMNLAFLSAISGETIFMVGPPGIAKSLIARRLKFAFKNARSFEYLMHRFSTPDEIFGPISITKLKNEDILERNIDHYLPGANIAFLDEIWKAGPSIQNTLLTIINERKFLNGEEEIGVDLFGILAASNELPEKDQGLEALWDRFLIRVLVKNIENRDNFEEMILDTKDLYIDVIPEELKITKDEYYEWQDIRDNISVPTEVLNVINHIRVKIQKYNDKLLEEESEEPLLYVSDRRWKKIIKVLRTCAFLNGRNKVELIDCFLISYFIWNIPDQIDYVSQIVKECIQHQSYMVVPDVKSIRNVLEKIKLEVDNSIRHKEIRIIETPRIIKQKYYAIDNDDLDYKLIKIKEFNQLEENIESNLLLFNDNFDYQLKEDVIKLKNYQIRIDDKHYYLIMDELEKEDLVISKPSSLLHESWDKRMEDIIQIIKDHLSRISNYVSIELEDIKDNLFVSSHKADVILQKIEEVKTIFQQLELKCRELKDYYYNIEEKRTEISVKNKNQFEPDFAQMDNEDSIELRTKLIDELSNDSNKSLMTQNILDSMKLIPRHIYANLELSFKNKSNLTGMERDVLEKLYRNKPMSITTKQTSSAPNIIAIILSLASLEIGDKLLFIGAKGGYIQSLAAQIIGSSGNIISYSTDTKAIEKNKTICGTKTPYGSIMTWISGTDIFDTSKLQSFGKFDCIFVNGRMPEIPKQYVELMKLHGKLIAPIGDNSRQKFLVIQKEEEGIKEREISELSLIFGLPV